MIRTLTIAAMLLSIASAAHARPAAEWQCGEVKVAVTKLTSDHLAEVSFTGFYRDLLKKRGFKFQFTKDYMGAKLNGKRCEVIEDEDAKLYRERVKACHDRGEPVCAGDFETGRWKRNNK
jgi:hypothetical protein